MGQQSVRGVRETALFAPDGSKVTQTLMRAYKVLSCYNSLERGGFREMALDMSFPFIWLETLHDSNTLQMNPFPQPALHVVTVCCHIIILSLF